MVRIRPAQPHSIVIEPFLGNGATLRGVYVEHDDRLPPVLGRVRSVHPTVTGVQPGMVVIFRQHTYDESPWTGGTVCILWERGILAVLDGYKEETNA